MANKKNYNSNKLTTLTEAEPIKKVEGFSTLWQGNLTNHFTSTKAVEGKSLLYDNITNQAKITKAGTTFSIGIPNYSKSNIPSITTDIMFDILMKTLTESGTKSSKVLLRIDEYMKLRELKDRKTAIEQIRRELSILRSCYISFQENLGQSNEIRLEEINIGSAISIDTKANYFSFTFSEPFFNAIKKLQIITAYPDALFKINPKKYPNAYNINKKIALQCNMNLGTPTENIIGVKTLLKEAPAIPSYEKVKSQRGSFYHKIKEPLEKSFEPLEEYYSWEYCKAKGKPLTNEELQLLEGTKFDYFFFESLNIKITWKKPYPFKEERLEKKEKAKALAEANETKKKRGRPKKEQSETT